MDVSTAFNVEGVMEFIKHYFSEMSVSVELDAGEKPDI